MKAVDFEAVVSEIALKVVDFEEAMVSASDAGVSLLDLKQVHLPLPIELVLLVQSDSDLQPSFPVRQ